MKVDQERWELWWDEMATTCRTMKSRGRMLLALRDMDSDAVAAYLRSASLDESRHCEGDHADPTFAAIDNESQTEAVIRVDLWLGQLFASLPVAYKEIMRMSQLNYVIENRGDARVGPRNDATKCGVCEAVVSGVKEDRLRLGYLCDTCYRAWRKWSQSEIDAGRDASPVRFRFERTSELDARKARRTLVP